jgi:hypothetical protein
LRDYQPGQPREKWRDFWDGSAATIPPVAHLRTARPVAPSSLLLSASSTVSTFNTTKPRGTRRSGLNFRRLASAPVLASGLLSQ